jgi:hypothetical protein
MGGHDRGPLDHSIRFVLFFKAVHVKRRTPGSLRSRSSDVARFGHVPAPKVGTRSHEIRVSASDGRPGCGAWAGRWTTGASGVARPQKLQAEARHLILMESGATIGIRLSARGRSSKDASWTCNAGRARKSIYHPRRRTLNGHRTR